MRKSLMALAALTMALATPLPGALAQSLQTWSGSISYGGNQYSFTMVGTNPATTNTTTTIVPYIVPIKMVYTNATFDPLVDQWHGMSVVNAIIASPLFQPADWRFGGTDMGTTQYVDAFQRGSFWYDVSVNTNYHVVFAQPVVLPEQVINVGTAAMQTNGQTFGQIQKSVFQPLLEGYLQQLQQINPSVLPIFVTDDVGLCDGPECDQAGFHTHVSGQTYIWSSFITYVPDNLPSSLPPDVSNLTHELAEWMDDPFVTANSAPCGDGYLEVADPLEVGGHWIPLSSTFSYNWHLQELAFMQYFGEPVGFSANDWYDDGHVFTGACQNGQ